MVLALSLPQKAMGVVQFCISPGIILCERIELGRGVGFDPCGWQAR